MNRTAPVEGPPWPNATRAWLMVAVLMGGYTCAFIDRQILSLLVEPIRRDLHISDTQFSLLGGLAFMIFYIGLVMPLAWVADRSNRRALVSIAVGVWSLMTAACGLANGFWALFAARMGVGAGEAALTPAAYSMISDCFPPERRARAMAIYSSGALAGAGLALIIGGAVIQWAINAGPVSLPLVGAVRTWQLAFFLVSVPGLVVLCLLQFIREPARREAAGGSAQARISVRELLRDRSAAFFLITFGFALLGIAIASYLAWAPTVLHRTFGWTAPQAGLAFGAMMLFGSTTGAVVGGVVVDRLRARGMRDAALRTAIAYSLVALPFAVAMPFAPNGAWAAALLAASIFAFGLTNGLAPATFQAMAPNQLRARLFALYFAIGNPIAFVVGPTGVAMISDRLLHDQQRIGAALALLTAIVIPAGVILFALALAPFRRCLDVANLLERAAGPAAVPAVRRFEQPTPAGL